MSTSASLPLASQFWCGATISPDGLTLFHRRCVLPLNRWREERFLLPNTDSCAVVIQFKRPVISNENYKKPENAFLLRFPVSIQQAKERSSLLSPRIMTRVLSHSISPPGHPLRGFPPTPI